MRPRVDFLPGRAVARAEAAVVEHQRVQPGRGEHLGEAVQDLLGVPWPGFPGGKLPLLTVFRSR